MSYNIIKNDNNFSSHYIKKTFTQEQKKERRNQLKYIKNWAKKHNQDPREALYFYTYDEIKNKEQYEQMEQEYKAKNSYWFDSDNDDY